MRTLNPPEEITQAADRQEVCRVWIDGGMMSISLALTLPDGYEDPALIWGMLISDIFHHVADAISLETGETREEITTSLEASFRSVVETARGARAGNIRTFTRRLKTLPDPDVSGDNACVEIVRIFLVPDAIRVLVLVGMWLPDNEESVWGNILYDITSLVAASLATGEEAEMRHKMIEDILHYAREPSCAYSGQYYGLAKKGAPPQSGD